MANTVKLWSMISLLIGISNQLVAMLDVVGKLLTMHSTGHWEA